MRQWQIEFYNPHPNARVRFTVSADNYEAAVIVAEQVIRNMRMTVCYSLTPSTTTK